MASKIHLFIAVALTLLSATAPQAQQPSSHQPSSPRDDPATVGAGPTSSAPGQTNYDPPKGASVTTDDRGVTTTNSADEDSKSKGVRPDRGNESYDATAPDGKLQARTAYRVRLRRNSRHSRTASIAWPKARSTSVSSPTPTGCCGRRPSPRSPVRISSSTPATWANPR